MKLFRNIRKYQREQGRPVSNRTHPGKTFRQKTKIDIKKLFQLPAIALALFFGLCDTLNAQTIKPTFINSSQGMSSSTVIIGEDMSRVVLNLVNIAFDVMREKAKTDPAYQAVLTLRSKRQGDKVIFSISDNGPGIPESINDKILQPFLTTKKGTDGTGLGLSITHDIVKANGGTIDIHSKPGQTVFKIII